MLFIESCPDYFTATILESKHLLKPDKYKDVIVSSLQFLIKENRIKFYGFAVMSNHIHVKLQVQRDYLAKDV